MTVARRPGALIAGKYRLVRELGAGGMGSVWEALHDGVGRRCAIKFMLPELAGVEEARRRFERESRSAGPIENEHVVAIFDNGLTIEGDPFFVMEYLEGEDLRRLLERHGALSAARAAALVHQAAQGLQAVHESGAIHRDIKPANLFVTRRKNGAELCKVLDFGVTKALATPGAATTSGGVVGTVQYMSPEQIRGDPRLDARSDVYALGCVLYESLTGRLPHEEREPYALMYEKLNVTPRRIDSVHPGLPAALGNIVARALELDPKERPSAKELARALEPWARARHGLPPRSCDRSSRAPAGAECRTATAWSALERSSATPGAPSHLNRRRIVYPIVVLGLASAALLLLRWGTLPLASTPSAGAASDAYPLPAPSGRAPSSPSTANPAAGRDPARAERFTRTRERSANAIRKPASRPPDAEHTAPVDAEPAKSTVSPSYNARGARFDFSEDPY